MRAWYRFGMHFGKLADIATRKMGILEVYNIGEANRVGLRHSDGRRTLHDIVALGPDHNELPALILKHLGERPMPQFLVKMEHEHSQRILWYHPESDSYVETHDQKGAEDTALECVDVTGNAEHEGHFMLQCDRAKLEGKAELRALQDKQITWWHKRLEKKLIDAGASPNGMLCSLCSQKQFDTPSGPTCIAQHGGEEGYTPDATYEAEIMDIPADVFRKLPRRSEEPVMVPGPVLEVLLRNYFMEYIRKPDDHRVTDPPKPAPPRPRIGAQSTPERVEQPETQEAPAGLSRPRMLTRPRIAGQGMEAIRNMKDDIPWKSRPRIVPQPPPQANLTLGGSFIEDDDIPF